MKKIFNTKIGILLIILPLIFQSCITFTGIIEEEDIVYSTKRVFFKHTGKDHTWRSPLESLEQTFVKEIKGNKNATYKVYDVLTLNSKSFRLEDKIFMIVDKDVFNVTIDNKEYEITKDINTNTSNILTSDSTKVSVVTGYSEENRKITRFSYCLTDEMVAKLKKANKVTFRYYAGPSMISVKLNNNELKKLKKLINKR
ncbi:hypothetical protein LJC30_00745 [Odoribacter sp. OttesenSCG-928-L07]|nr:hypothetical protein [Odoribacter sp. OttesenSCG-928-L07]MDL2238717.1 hypothetical protein [Bacteroidales bacterium OttesenSCG-928-L14]